MKCHVCHADCDDNQTLCSDCGSKISEDQPAEVQVNAEENTETAEKRTQIPSAANPALEDQSQADVVEEKGSPAVSLREADERKVNVDNPKTEDSSNPSGHWMTENRSSQDSVQTITDNPRKVVDLGEQQGTQENRTLGRHHNKQYGSDEQEVLNIKFNAFLRHGIELKNDRQAMGILIPENKTGETSGHFLVATTLEISKTTENEGTMFEGSLEIQKSEAEGFIYQYALLDKPGQRGFYNVAQKEKIDIDRLDYWRKLNLESHFGNVFQQFDDMCMKTDRTITQWRSKRTLINGLRPKYLKHVLHDLINNIQIKDLPKVQEKVEAFLRSITCKKLQALNGDEVTISNEQDLHKIWTALDEMIEMFKERHPVQIVLNTALCIKSLNLTEGEMVPPSIEKLATIVKNNFDLKPTFSSLEDSVRKSAASAVEELYIKACKVQCCSGIIWFMALFYALIPDSEKRLLLPDNVNWEKTDSKVQQELKEMVQSHQTQINKNAGFAMNVLQMFSVHNQDVCVIKNLDLSPKILLHQLLERLDDVNLSDSKSVINTISEKIKKWLESRNGEGCISASPYDVQDDIMACLNLTVGIISKSTEKEKWNCDLQNVFTSLMLLNSFTGFSNLFQDNQEFYQMCHNTFPELLDKFIDCILSTTDVKTKQQNLDPWIKLFEIGLPGQLEDMWKKKLKAIFIQRIQQENPTVQVKYYCTNEPKESTVEDCLLQCATSALDDLYHSKDQALLQKKTLEEISKCKKYDKLISTIVGKVLYPLKCDTSPDFLLTEPCQHLLSTIEQQKKKNSSYTNKLTSEAKELIEIAHRQMNELLESIRSMTAPCNLVSSILENPETAEFCRLFAAGEKKKSLDEAFGHAKEEFKKYEYKRRQLQYFFRLCDSSSGLTVASQLRQKSEKNVSQSKCEIASIMEMLDNEEDPVNFQMLEKIDIASESIFFQDLWKKNISKAKETDLKNVTSVSASEVQGKLYKPTVEEFRKSYDALKNITMSLHDFEHKFGPLKLDKSKTERELQKMARFFGDNNAWIKETLVRIERYPLMMHAVGKGKLINTLKEEFSLSGDFTPVTDFQDIDMLKQKCLKELTDEMEKTAKKLNCIPKNVLDFLEELLQCAKKEFISWIKSIIKDSGQLTVFVDLASTSAGESGHDIDKICNFRDAVSASSPIIYIENGQEEAGFDELMDAIETIKEALSKDKHLQTKLRESCSLQDWLKAVYEMHGSVERSSLLQARAINKTGVYSLKLTSEGHMVTLEDCITLKINVSQQKGENIEKKEEVQYKQYCLTELKELQNKLMLITASQDQGKEEITRYVEIFEQILLAGKLFLQLRDAGHVLFMDWDLKAYCDPERSVKVLVDFGIAGVTIRGFKPLHEELKGLCKSMQGCLDQWQKYMEDHRKEYYYLNYFTAKQLVTLGCSIAKLQRSEELDAEVLNLLSFIKENITETDFSNAFKEALQCPVTSLSGATVQTPELRNYCVKFPELIKLMTEAGFTERDAQAGIMHCMQTTDEDAVDEQSLMDCIYDHVDDDAWVEEWSGKYVEAQDHVLQNQMKFKGGHSPEQLQSAFRLSEEEITVMFEKCSSCQEKISMVWKAYCDRLSGLVSDKYVGLDILGETLKQLAKSEIIVKRNFSRFLEKGKPNLITCKDVEMLPLCLSVYCDGNQPLPTYDELLTCTPETTFEEVELLIRRAMQAGDKSEKIYSLFNAEKLNYDVSKRLESCFYQMSQSQDGNETKCYNLIIFCESKAHHSYVLTAFDVYKKTLPPPDYEKIQNYLKQKLVPSTAIGCVLPKEFQQNIKLVSSEWAGMGKSLFVKTVIQKSLKENPEGQVFAHHTIRLTESKLKPECIVDQLQKFVDKPNDNIPRIFHIDVPPVVSKGLYTFMVQLFVLRCFHSSDGSIWRCKDSHLYLVEYTERKHRGCDRQNSEISMEMEDSFLKIFPTVKCLSPQNTLDHLEQGNSSTYEQQLMHESEFRSEAFQRTYQYLKTYKNRQNLQHFTYDKENIQDTPKEWLKCFLHYYDNNNPSWAELRNFTHFLNVQLKKCEESVFCSVALQDDLSEFKSFVVQFMITMSKDFSMRSIEISDESNESVEAEDRAILDEFKLRRRWEQQAHPYIMFNADGASMTFLGFHIKNLHAIDIHTKEVIQENVITRQLFNQLRAQKVPFNVEFEKLPRQDQLDILCRVLGVCIDKVKDPDETYQLTLDNVLKILAIHLRFQCDIPVIVMGETGCGKTRLVQFMCKLLNSGKEGDNMIIVRVHGGTTSKGIYKKVWEAVEIAQKNEVQGMDTVLFFDEANTTEAVYAIKEVICDKTVNGEPMNAPRLKVIAACNPYKKHSKEVVEKLEKAGLGYRVHSNNTEERFGHIPMRQLVYRVQPLPPSISPLVWDFGELNQNTQELYIKQMVKTFMEKEGFDEKHVPAFTRVISTSQRHIAGMTDECRMVSLRDIERCMKTVVWFYEQRGTLFPMVDEKKGENMETSVDDAIRSLILAVGVCYYTSLENRAEYIEKIAASLSMTSEEVCKEIHLCQDVFIDNVDCLTFAKNDALKENVFMMVVCMNLRIPLFLVGKPGSSKSLSKTVTAEAMKGKFSMNDLFKIYKQVQLVPFQCSPHSTPEGIISTFRQCAQFQKNQNLDEYVSVVVLDEIGLAEDSPKMPLKTLHPLLEDGCVDDEKPEDFKKVGFIGISNWALDPAKMNRGILVLRSAPEKEELIKTAEDMCSSAKPVNTEIRHLITKLSELYMQVLAEQKCSEFFGLRDYYSLVKSVVACASDGNPSGDDVAKAVQRNFGGFDSINALQIFHNVFKTENVRAADTISLLKENLDKSGFSSRYLLLPTTNSAALTILNMLEIIDEGNTEIIFGSGFPQDQEYSQVCRTVNRVKICMETGRPVILLNIQSLYESLYDALNQCYVKLGGSYYVDLGLGTHRVKCRVREEFRLIVIEEKNVVYEQFPTPLLNRLEKHCLEISTIFPEHAKKIEADLEKWVDALVKDNRMNTKQIKCDSIIGYTDDTCASVLLQLCPKLVDSDWDQTQRGHLLVEAKEQLIQCATPDSVLRVVESNLINPAEIQDLYFSKQIHNNLINVLKKHRSDSPRLYLQVSTYSRLLNQRDVKLINEELNITRHHSRLFLLHEFQTEEAFSQALREFFNTEIEGRKLLLLQFYFEEPKKSQQLLSCARHSVRRITKSLKTETAVDIVLLTRLPRISGGCGYIAMCGDSWTSLHLDELLPVKVFPADTSRLCKMTISEILRESFACVEDGQNGSTDGDHLDDGSKRRGMLVDTVYLLKQSMQKGIVQLRDKVHNTDRAKKRIDILHDLLYTDDSVSHNFMKTLQRRIVHLLSAQEKATDPKQNWVICQALSDAFVVEGASFRHMLWIQMEDTVASALAQILAVVDGDNNLDHIALDQPSAKTELWLKVFQQDDLLSFPVIVKSKDAHVVFSTMEDREKTTTCSFPFSWVLKARFDKIWLNVIDLHGTALPKLPELKYVQKYEELINYPWVHDIKKTNSLFDMYAEDLVKMSIPGSPCELNKIFSESLVQLAQSLYSGLTGDDPDNVSLIWLHVTYEYMRENHQIFLSLSQKYNDLMPAGRAKEASQAIKLILQELYPERILKDLDSCQKWLEMVKSLTTSVELIISQDTLVSMYGENGQELIKEIRLLWQSTRIVFLLMDHLLQDTEMEEKLLKVVVRNFIFLHKKIQAEVGNMEKTFKLVTQVLKQCSTNACKVYLEGQTHCLYCKKEFSDENTAELSCGHMFCISCLEEDDSKKCRKCQKEIQTPYKKCEAVKRDTILKVNKFRRKCNSFFVEFVHNYYAGEGVQMTEGVVDMLMEYIGGNPSKQQIKATEESPLRECMNPNSTVQSLVLKILLRCRVEDMESHWQKFFEAVKSSKQNLEEFYFLVVRSTEDYIHTSARECMLRKATESLCVDSLMSDSSDRTVTFKDLHTIAKLRFCLTVAADTIGSLFISGEKAHDDQKDFLQKLNEVISDSRNPWIQIFLLRNLIRVHGFKFLRSIQRDENFHWLFPNELSAEEEATVPKIDKFLIYGEMYDEVTDSSVKAIENPSYNFEMNNDGTKENFPVCMTLAAVQQIVDGRASIENESCLVAKIKEQSKTDKKWEKLSEICEKVTEGCLSKVSEELSLSHRPSLAHIVLHTAVVAHLSPLPEMQLLKALCFDPSKSKDCFIPTMPDMEYESLQTKTEKLWRCRCGEPVVLENCGMPWVEAKCPRCKAKIGGQSHKPVDGFTQIDTQEDKQKGHILGDPSSRVSAECGRSLSGASLCLVRALIHSSMLWGAIDNTKDIETIVKGSTHGVGKHLSTHLLKDIELLAKVAGKNEEDAEMTIHLFLQHIIECSKNTVSDSELKQDIHSTETREKRNEWENALQKRTGKFFLDIDKKLSDVHDHILKSQNNVFLQIAYSKIPPLKDLPTTGLFNLPLMWRYEKRTSVQHLIHLVERENGKEKYPVLLELLNKHGHIHFLRYLPQILSLQWKLIHFFHYTDVQDWKDMSIDKFAEDCLPDEASFKESVSILLKIWTHMKEIHSQHLSEELRQKDQNNMMIIDLLPQKPSVTRAVTEYLAEMQRDCITCAIPNEKRMITAGEVKSSHVITCNPEEDFLPIAISNIDYVVNEDGTESTDYNFKTLEKQLISRFISEKPLINLTTLPSFEVSPVNTLNSFFLKDSVKENLESLNSNDKNCIMNDLRLLNEISAALSTLKIAIGFLELSFGHPDTLLIEYMKNELRMGDRAQHLNLPVLRTSKVKHIQSLWEILSARRSVLLTEMNQNPFFMIDEVFHGTLSEDETRKLRRSLETMKKIDFFIIELHDFIMNIKPKGFPSSWTIDETFKPFLDDKNMEEQSIEHLVAPLKGVQMKCIVAVWKLAVHARTN